MTRPLHQIIGLPDEVVTVQRVERYGVAFFYAFSSTKGSVGSNRLTREEAETDVFNYKQGDA